jgi:hypothetical protein
MKWLTAKEISARLSEDGIMVSAQWVRDAWKIGAPNRLRRYARLELFEKWMDENPNATPRAKKHRNFPMKQI